MKPQKRIRFKRNKLNIAKEILARQMHIMSNSFYGNFGVELFNKWNEQSKQENLPDKKLKINDTYKKE